MLISKEINVNQSNILKVNDIVKHFFINAEVLYIILNTIGKYRNLLHKLCLSYLKGCAYFFFIGSYYSLMSYYLQMN